MYEGLFTTSVTKPTFVIFEISLTLAVGFVSWYTYKIWRIHDKYKHLPGPPRSSFYLGHVSDFIKRRKKGEMMVQTLQKYFEEYGDTFVIYFMHDAFVFTVDPLSIKELLITGEHPKSEVANAPVRKLCGARFLGRGLVTETDHKVWERRRTMLNPAFNRQFLKTSMMIFNEIGDTLMNKLAAYADSETYIDIAQEIHKATLDVIGKSAFGADIDSLNKTSAFSGAMSNILKGFAEVVADPFFEKNPFTQRELKKHVRESCALLRNYGRQLVEERKKVIETGAEVPNDVLTLVIKANENISEFIMEETLDDFVTIFGAGQETTANALAFSLLEIGRLPHVTEELKKEIDDKIGSASLMEFEEVNQLAYTQNVFKESLRMYPPAALTFRDTAYDTEIGGYKVPKDTVVMTSMYVAARRIPKAEEFIPERFEPDSTLKPQMYTFFPFSLGPRNCIGQTFAMLEGKLLLAKFIQRFDFELHPEQSFEVEQRATLRPRDGVRMKLTMR